MTKPPKCAARLADYSLAEVVRRANQLRRCFCPPAGRNILHFLDWRWFCLKPIIVGGQAAYQTELITRLKQYYPDAFTRFGPSLWNTIGKFFAMDLSQIDVLMYDCYSIFGPPPRLPSNMVRSFMLSLVMKKTNFTDWSEELKTNPIAAIISGFHPDDTPGVGTFYDFCDRLWMSDKDNLSDHAKPPKKGKLKNLKIRMTRLLLWKISRLRNSLLFLSKAHPLKVSHMPDCSSSSTSFF